MKSSKSREYMHKVSGVIYWLEDNSVMMRKPGCDGIVKRSVITAARFFELVNDGSMIVVQEPVPAKTIHTDKYGDKIHIYRSLDNTTIFIDGLHDEDDGVVAFRGIYGGQQAREIADRLNKLADMIEGK